MIIFRLLWPFCWRIEWKHFIPLPTCLNTLVLPWCLACQFLLLNSQFLALNCWNIESRTSHVALWSLLGATTMQSFGSVPHNPGSGQIGQSDLRPPGCYPLTEWKLALVTRDPHYLIFRRGGLNSLAYDLFRGWMLKTLFLVIFIQFRIRLEIGWTLFEYFNA